MVSTEKFFGAIDGNDFGFINFFTAAVVALAWITFGILI
jgi:hypothetical protein